jgi:2-hydroxychromene-2-carboxylate isomerase
MYSVLKVAEQVGLDVDALKHDMGDPAIDRLLEKNRTLAEALPVTGTPTFIIDDSMESRFLSYDALRQKIASIRDSGGCRLC